MRRGLFGLAGLSLHIESMRLVATGTRFNPCTSNSVFRVAHPPEVDL